MATLRSLGPLLKVKLLVGYMSVKECALVAPHIAGEMFSGLYVKIPLNSKQLREIWLI